MRRFTTLLLLGTALASSAFPCFNLGSRHYGGWSEVRMVKEDAIIVWDRERNIEHFIRKAQFNHGGKDFGFLVPTPTTPTLAAANDDAFKLLTDVSKMPEWTLPFSGGGGIGGGSGGFGSTVVVRQSKEVGQYQAASLEASNLEALQAWLKKNEYESSNELMQWLAPYVKNRWIINAFRISRKASEGDTEMTPIRLSFRTPRPFYPYREPKAKGEARHLRLYVIADRSVTGHLTDGLSEESWLGPAKKLDFPEERRAELAQKLGMTEPQLPESMKLTVFNDVAPIRQSKDVVFQLENEKPKRNPFGFTLASGAFALCFAARLRRR